MTLRVDDVAGGTEYITSVLSAATLALEMPVCRISVFNVARFDVVN